MFMRLKTDEQTYWNDDEINNPDRQEAGMKIWKNIFMEDVEKERKPREREKEVKEM